ncbi:MAG TPA: TIGR03960 family B12-binding radical SAM protein [Acidimicrobiales bacterium]|nr:TIGR03960 family B12-binding radical SAM protein [Actinomycetes bacterium]HJM72138.1 TIGR03960 family B12-binding radical SAM protein [Acidimicrobiales bacterium]
MSSLWSELERVLGEVQKPARYIGCEDGMTVPDHHPDAVAWLLLYPDTYEVGLPNQGLQILYEILNERSDAVAERSYAPWTDLAEVLRREGLPLFSVDTHRPARDFDILAFNLSAELVFTNVLECVDLAGIPVRTADRTDDDPLVLVGGHCAYNPEPLADYVDAAVLGDGEEVVGEITEVVAAWKAAGGGLRGDLHRRLAMVAGVYVPSLYEATFADGRLQGVRPRPESTEVVEVVEKRTVADLADWPYPKKQLVPVTEVVHDRLNVEVFRGCTRGCRFCQAGMITRPVRERPAGQVRTMVSEGLKRTGYDEVALTSLSTADFSGIEQVVAETVADDACGQVSVSLPSLRVDAFTVGIAAEIQKARRTGLTFAPEAGSWRMRQVINKLIREEDLYAAVEAAYSQGWRRVKLYFLTGLPTETDEDTLGILHMARRCVEVGRQHIRNPSVTVSVGGFVPKPFTPFQWFGQNTETELRRKVGVLRDELKRDTKGYRGVQLKWHDPRATAIEGLLSRGDRRLGPVVEDVWRSGGVFQEWSEHFNLELWTDALERQGLTLEEMVYRHRTEDEAFAWDHLSAGLHRDFLWQDWRDALEAVGLEDCRWTPCYDCGACTGYGIEHVVASAVPPAGGSQGTGQDLVGGGEVPVLLTARPDTSQPNRGAPAPVGSA